MKEITLKVGKFAPGGPSNGGFSDTKKVKFEGEELARYRQGDNRGTDKFLYRAKDGRLLLYVHDFNNWQGKTNTKTLDEVTEDEVIENHPQLAQRSGIKETWELDEVLGG